jgi:hypothetical protein
MFRSISKQASIHFSTFKMIFLPKEPNLGRWSLKKGNEVDYYMTKLHADPGYKFTNYFVKTR